MCRMFHTVPDAIGYQPRYLGLDAPVPPPGVHVGIQASAGRLGRHLSAAAMTFRAVQDPGNPNASWYGGLGRLTRRHKPRQ